MRLGIKHRIWLLPAITTLIFAMGVAVALSLGSQALAVLKHVGDTDYPLLDRTKALSVEIQRIGDDLNSAVAEGEKGKLADADRRALVIRGHVNEIARLDGQADFANNLRGAFDAYYKPASATARIMLKVEPGDARASAAEMQPALRKLTTLVEEATASAERAFADRLEDTGDDLRKAFYATALAALVALAVMLAASYLIVRAIWRQLGGEPEYATRIVHAIAAGDLSQPIEIAPGDRNSQLAALKTMQESLARLIREIREAAQTVRHSSREIAGGMMELSSRTEEQAVSLERTAANMHELTATVRQSAEDAVRARDVAAGSTQVAGQGRDAVAQAVKSMDEIDAASKRMQNIVAVIDGIAFQTNILALNAAVEAARAGEAGRGFAVVAAEVRNLAQSCTAQARDIKRLIGGSIAQVEGGRARVTEAGATLDRVVSSIDQVAQVVTGISSASVQQSAGISEMGKAVAQIEGVTQHNAALVEETSATAQSMAEQAARLEAAVSVFRLLAQETLAAQHLLEPRDEGGRFGLDGRAEGSHRAPVPGNQVLVEVPARPLPARLGQRVEER